MTIELRRMNAAQICECFMTDQTSTISAFLLALNDNFDPTHVLELLKTVAIRGHEWLTTEQLQTFQEVITHQVILVLLEKIVDSTYVKSIQEFIIFTLRQLCNDIANGHVQSLFMLASIFDEHHAHYVYYGHERNHIEADPGFIPQDYIMDEESSTSACFRYYLAYWCYLGGFQICFDNLKNSCASGKEKSEQPWSFESVQCVYRVLYAGTEVFSYTFLRKLIEPLTDTTSAYIKSLPSSAFYAISKDSMLELISIIQLLQSKALAGGDNQRRTEIKIHLIILDTLYRYFQSSSLEKRIFGLAGIQQEMTQIVETNLPCTARFGDTQAGFAFLSQWIDESHLLSILFDSSNGHCELVKRCLPLLQVFASLQWLPKMLNFVWDCYISASEGTFKEAIEEILLQYLTILPESQLTEFFYRIQSQQFLNTGILLFLSLISDRSSELSVDIIWFLWSCLPKSSSDDSVECIFQNIMTMLKHPVGCKDTQLKVAVEILVSCQKNITERQHISISLRMMTLLALFIVEDSERDVPSSNNDNSPKSKEEKGILSLIDANLIVQACLEEFEDYKSSIDKAALDNNSHLLAVKTKLLALRASWMLLCYTHESRNPSEGSISLNQLQIVWKLTIMDSVTTDEASLGFQWLEYCVTTMVKNVGLMKPFLIHDILDKQFAKLNSEDITQSALQCFHTLFRILNTHNGSLCSIIQKASENDNEETVLDLVTAEGELIGIVNLWQLTIKARDADVAEELISLLVGYYTDFHPELYSISSMGPSIPVMKRLEFVETCMAYLSIAKYNAEASNSTIEGIKDTVGDVGTVTRCVDLLGYFLEACDAEPTTQQQSEKRDAEGYDLGGPLFPMHSLDKNSHTIEIEPSPVLKPTPSPSANFLKAGRRPSWTFQQQNSLLEVIPDSEQKCFSEGLVNGKMETDDKQDAALQLNLMVSTSSSTTKQSRQSSSPSVRSRPNLKWGNTLSPSKGPQLLLDEISNIFSQETDQNQSDPHKNKKENQLLPRSTSIYGLASTSLIDEKNGHFEQLFDLVEWNNKTSQRAWELLCRLPINKKLLKKMIRIRPTIEHNIQGDEDVKLAVNTVVWKDLFVETNVHRLLYSLRIVEALLPPVHSTHEGKEQKEDYLLAQKQWRERFVRLGGLAYLYSILENWTSKHLLQSGNTTILPEAEDEPLNSETLIHSTSLYCEHLYSTCLAALVRTLTYFLELHYAGSQAQSNTHLDFDNRLYHSTLPSFVKQLDFEHVVQIAVYIANHYSEKLLPTHVSSIPTEWEEVILCSIQLFSSVCKRDKSIPIKIFDQNREKVTIDLHAWCGALLITCSSNIVKASACAALAECACQISYGDQVRPFTGSSLQGNFSNLLTFAVMDIIGANRSNSNLEYVFKLLSEYLLTLPYTNDLVIKRFIDENIGKQIVSKLAESSAITNHKRVEANLSSKSNICGFLDTIGSLVQLSPAIFESILLTNVGSELSSLDTSKHLSLVEFLLSKFIFGGIHWPAEIIIASKKVLYVLLWPKLLSSQQNLVDSQRRTIQTVLTFMQSFQISVLHQLSETGRPWEFAPQQDLQNPSECLTFVGLSNPGCVCYMNALVQQLFHLPIFRDGVMQLSLDCITPNKNMTPSSSQLAKWSVQETTRMELHELQKLFVTLANTNRNVCDPTDFALSHRDTEGCPTDLRVQMDADEFFCVLLDRIETYLNFISSPNSSSDCKSASDFMFNCFGGILVNQIMTADGNLSEREENFVALSLEVSKKQCSLIDSLELYVKSEKLDGENAYFCEVKQEKVSATKRVCIKRLPRTLVFHLKRFEFDFDTMEKIKVNEMLDFPLELNMAPYTTSNVNFSSESAENYGAMYDLVGVVVHSGTADMGHYYSYIKNRSLSSSHLMPWLEFNDDVVRGFDIETMSEECFGGEETIQAWDAGLKRYVSTVQLKKRSAYMLIYEQKLMKEDEKVKTQQVSSSVSSLIQSIQIENSNFQKLSVAFDPSYELLIHRLASENEILLKSECLTSPLPIGCNMTDLIDLREYLLKSADLPAKILMIICQYLFGIWSLYPKPTMTAINSEDSNTLALKLLSKLLAISAQHALTEGKGFKNFSAWLLCESQSSSRATQRTWVFDYLYIRQDNSEMLDGFFQLLEKAVSCCLKSGKLYTPVVEKFLQYIVYLVYDREEITLHNPKTYGNVTVSFGARVSALSKLQSFLYTIITANPKLSAPIFLAPEIQLIDRLLYSFVPNTDTTSKVPQFNFMDAINNVGDYNTLRMSVLPVEREFLRRIFENNVDMFVFDSNLLLNPSIFRNMLELELEDIVTSLLVSILVGELKRRSHSMMQSESSVLLDKLVAFLIKMLDMMKNKDLDIMLAIFNSMLEAEESFVKADMVDYYFSRQLYSPERGILEAASHYKNHSVLHEYTFLLVEYIILRAQDKKYLQVYFQGDYQLSQKINWVEQWLSMYLDPHGTIREEYIARSQSEEVNQSLLLSCEELELHNEVISLFEAADRTFGFNIMPPQHLKRKEVVGADSSPQIQNQEQDTRDSQLHQVESSSSGVGSTENCIEVTNTQENEDNCHGIDIHDISIDMNTKTLLYSTNALAEATPEIEGGVDE